MTARGRTEPTTERAAVPLVVLTGFLGAGKTTVLNRVLGTQHHRRVAILVNELGRIDIDASLIRGRAGDVLELTGGCVCHQIGVQRELIAALGDVIARSSPDVVVLETTGIAEPAAILVALRRARAPAMDAISGGRFGPIAVVTVVDAVAGRRQLDRHEEVRDQVTAADQILISKTDEGQPQELAALHRRLHDLNARAERAAFPATGAGTAALVPWLLDARPLAARAPAAAPRRGGASHAHQLAAATYVDDAPLIEEALLLACESLGDRLIRVKGFVHLAGEPRRGFLERAGDTTRMTLGEPWNDEPRLTRLVLIGEDLDEGALHRRLWACRADRAGATGSSTGPAPPPAPSDA
ncbi:MAG: GTP-binding protein [Pseudomonadota bacterium]